jgi:hypothetical protein
MSICDPEDSWIKYVCSFRCGDGLASGFGNAANMEESMMVTGERFRDRYPIFWSVFGEKESPATADDSDVFGRDILGL